ncbi:MAG TPA: hypothetical protein VFR44_13730 [Actinomycetota bacterium]|nr:hypothetical protein [Actinomycetota bacterium]
MVQGKGIPPSQLQRELADEKDDDSARAGAGQHHDGDRDRSTFARRGPQAAIRLILLLAALIALRFGVVWRQDWEALARATFDRTWQGWIGWLLLVVLSGFLFALAARLPRSFRYRPWTPLLLGMIPLLMFAHFWFWLNVNWPDAPRLFNATYFYDTFEAQFALAIMLGVALASGFKARDG